MIKKQIESCPFCGAKVKIEPFVCRIAELPKPFRLFGKWSLIKMRYREIPLDYSAECSKFCNGFAESQIFIIGKTKAETQKLWNEMVLKVKGELNE